MRLMFISLLLLITCKASTQTRPSYTRQLQYLDSISRSENISSRFAKVYYDLMLLINEQFKTTDTAIQRLVQHFEADLAASYINACMIYQHKTSEQLPAWKNYFAYSDLSPVQSKLLGANAHLNGCFSETVIRFYQEEEWNILNAHHSLFATCLNKAYKQFYKEAFRTNPRIKAFAFFTLGIDKLAGFYYVHKWTNRQRKLIKYHFDSDARYHKLLERINRKKENLDKLIVRLL